MIVFEILFWVLLVFTSYIELVYILFKGKQYNRFFGTFINTIVPILGSVPTYIMACKYEKRIGGISEKIDEKILRYTLVGMQAAAALLVFIPCFSGSDGSFGVSSLIFATNVPGGAARPTMILVYLLIFPLASAAYTYFGTKNNVSNFVAYCTALLNVLSIQLLKFVVSSSECSVNFIFYLYSILNVVIMFASILLMIKLRDKFLFKLEYKEKVEYIKDHKKNLPQKSEEKPARNMYKCAKCGKLVAKGTICSCIEKKAQTSEEIVTNSHSDFDSADSFCVYCKRPLKEGESCNCQGDGFGITVKNEESKNRKCIYCGQVLVGESTCVCEKIMKNSEPVKTDGDLEKLPRKYFESQVEKSNSVVADELAELEKKINSRFELVKENMELGNNQ